MLWHQPSATDLLFITLRKSEALFSPSTRYRGLAIGPSLFHWESQSSAGRQPGYLAVPRHLWRWRFSVIQGHS